MSSEAGAMDNDNKRMLTPKLRFPEFRGVPGWIEKRLEDVLLPVTRERTKPAHPYTGLGIRSHGKGTFLKPLEMPEKNSMENLYEVQSNDLIVNITFAWEGAIAIAQPSDTGALVSHRFPTYTFKKEVAVTEFFKYRILDKQFIYELGVISPGGAGRNRVLNKKDFLQLECFVPERAEQKKIAECLTSLDKLIAVQTDKLDALKARKKGLVQQLFLQEGETIPRLRFPEFKDSGEWHTCVFGDIVSRSFYGTSSSTSNSGAYPVLRMGNMVDGDLDIRNLTFIDLNEDDFDKFQLRNGDILLNRTNSMDLVGKVSLFELDGKYVAASYLVTFRLKTDFILPKFCNYLLNSQVYQQRIKRLATRAVSQANINPTIFQEQFVISFPSVAEQERVVECFSSNDQLIKAQKQKIDMLKAHKDGLLQQLFPVPDEVPL